jgi:hypothetical protein
LKTSIQRRETALLRSIEVVSGVGSLVTLVAPS